MSGSVPAVLALVGRGAFPYADLHGTPLYLHALRSLAASGEHDVVVAVDEADRQRVVSEVRQAGMVADVRPGSGWWERLRGSGGGNGLLIHDALCPLASSDFIRGLRRDADDRPGVSLMAYRPVTDTVKTVVDFRIHGTIDRESLAALVSPAVVAPDVLAAALQADDRVPVSDFARLAAWLRARGEVELVRAPSLARRVDDASAVNLLECLDELARQVRRERGAGDTGIPVTGGTGSGTR